MSMYFKDSNVRKKASLILGFTALFLALIIFVIISLPTFGGKNIDFISTYNDNTVTLQATYWEAENPEYAVLICPGYSCDRQKWRPMANLFASYNMSVMTFDYAGQGASSSTIGFDNAKTDAIPVEISDALELLHELSGIDYEHIILVGHSMGGRSILRLLYDYNCPDAATSVIAHPISNIILFSPEVNYNFNAQASLFAGTSDESEEPWHSYNESYTKGVNIYLYGSTADDIVSDEDILSIYKHLGGTNSPSAGAFYDSTVNASDSKITVGITSGVLHSYEMYSPKFCTFVNEALEDILLRDADRDGSSLVTRDTELDGSILVTSDADLYDSILVTGDADFKDSNIVSRNAESEVSSNFSNKVTNKVTKNISYTYSPLHFTFIYIGWALALFGLTLILSSLNSTVPADNSEKLSVTAMCHNEVPVTAMSHDEVPVTAMGHDELPVSDISADALPIPTITSDNLPTLINAKEFLLHKLLMWLPAIPVAVILCSLCVILPFGSPVMNIPYMCFISGFGIVMLLAYRKGHFRGTTGFLPRPTLKLNTSDKVGLLRAVSISLLLCFVIWFIFRASMYKLIPMNLRLFWLVFATILMTIGFYISGCEADMLKKAAVSRKIILLYNLIQYVALFILVLFYLVIKSYSGMIGQAQNMLLMYIFCIPMGSFLRAKTANRLIGAIVSAFLFQAIMITSAALIAIF